MHTTLLDFYPRPASRRETNVIIYNKEKLKAYCSNIFTVNSGVVLSIGQTCRKLGAKQSHFLVALMKTLKCFEENHQNKFLLNCAKLTPTDTGNWLS